LIESGGLCGGRKSAFFAKGLEIVNKAFQIFAIGKSLALLIRLA
jgi:hypothetical protein